MTENFSSLTAEQSPLTGQHSLNGIPYVRTDSSESMVLNALIVDDEPVARRILREELEQIDNIALIGEAEDGPSALSAIHDYPRIWFFSTCRCPEWEGSM